MKARLCLGLLAAGVLFVVGCGGSGQAEVPKNPVQLEKPGASADPGPGKGGGGALPNQQGAQPLK